MCRLSPTLGLVISPCLTLGSNSQYQVLKNSQGKKWMRKKDRTNIRLPYCWRKIIHFHFVKCYNFWTILFGFRQNVFFIKSYRFSFIEFKSAPLFNICVANECLNVWAVTRLCFSPTDSTARARNFRTIVGCRWWRHISPSSKDDRISLFVKVMYFKTPNSH